MIDPIFWNGRRVFLTGHTGFKGSWLLLWLLEMGADITGYSLQVEPEPNLFRQFQSSIDGNFTHIEADLSDRSALLAAVTKCNPNVVFHLAAQPLVRHSYADPLGTWSTNVIGSLNLLESLRTLQNTCATVMVTTDKVYFNREWAYGYRETDRLGGSDPYSASKAAAELAIASWRQSFCGEASHQTPHLRIATARAGNVIGGGDWAIDRIVPDAMRALAAQRSIKVRNQFATRSWQHVLEPLSGYLLLAEQLLKSYPPPCEAFNFGPLLSSNCSVADLIKNILQHWTGQWHVASDPMDVYEAGLLHLQIDKAHNLLGWSPRWDYADTVSRTVNWYRDVHDGEDPYSRTLQDIKAYHSLIVH